MENNEEREQLHFNDTSYIGYIEVRFDELVKLFGHPQEPPVDMQKLTQFVWFVTIEKHILRIYDWRQQHVHPFLISKWHVAANNFAAYTTLRKHLTKKGVDAKKSWSLGQIMNNSERRTYDKR